MPVCLRQYRLLVLRMPTVVCLKSNCFRMEAYSCFNSTPQAVMMALHFGNCPRCIFVHLPQMHHL